jgi:ABC-type enterochelin transport system substrate-binding protein
MKKVFMFFVVALAFASCGPKATEEATAVDAVEVVTVDSDSIDVTDSVEVD